MQQCYSVSTPWDSVVKKSQQAEGPLENGRKRLRDEETERRRYEGTKGRRDEETKGRRDSGTKGRRDEGTKGQEYEFYFPHWSFNILINKCIFNFQ